MKNRWTVCTVLVALFVLLGGVAVGQGTRDRLTTSLEQATDAPQDSDDDNSDDSSDDSSDDDSSDDDSSDDASDEDNSDDDSSDDDDSDDDE